VSVSTDDDINGEGLDVFDAARIVDEGDGRVFGVSVGKGLLGMEVANTQISQSNQAEWMSIDIEEL